MKEYLLIILPFAVVVGIIGFANHQARAKCEFTGEVAKRQVRYGMFTGCYIEDKGVFIPLENWRIE